MVLVPLFHASMRHDKADVMLCSDPSLIGGAPLYTNFVKWHLSHYEVVENFRSQLLRKSDLPSCVSKTISQHVWSFQEHINVLKGNASLTGLRWKLSKET